jgi:hypothetical protein
MNGKPSDKEGRTAAQNTYKTTIATPEEELT